ncbi:S-layer homology domain-containing protein [Saccharibacillus sp. JS10]|uniref:S-layer homology domain-containing protein n=1 Tax=Saccharibacillus sp. JS10 TaxID=2950552 RepID=UPI00210B6C86|nr:S-layer homology domain-containing protein [Saccharibacillus sp. JS10]MCQ4086179.1 S-layer homology domain-containing protein [Saccharibacillus sp. JS10]
MKKFGIPLLIFSLLLTMTSFLFPSYAKAAATADLTDINGAQGTITVSNAEPGQLIRVYDSNDNFLLVQKAANSSGEATLDFTFRNSDGDLVIKSVSNDVESLIVNLPYSGVDIPDPPQPTAALTDITGDQGTVTVSNVASGQVVRVYSDVNVELAQKTADSGGSATLTFTFPTSNGELSIRTVANGTETEIAALPYSGITIPVIPQPTAVITNIDGDQGTITVSNVASGQVVRVYSDANVELAQKTADSGGSATLTFTFPTSNGELSVRTVANGTETEITTLPYSGVTIPVIPQPTAVINNIDGDQGTVTVSNVASGQVVRVYSDANVELAQKTADSGGSATLTFTFPTSNGELSIRTVANGTETEITTLPYSGVTIPVIPQPNTPTAVLESINSNQGVIKVTYALDGQRVRVYSDTNIKLAEKVADIDGKATLSFTFPSANGELSVRVVDQITEVETQIKKLTYTGIVFPNPVPTNPNPSVPNPPITFIPPVTESPNVTPPVVIPNPPITLPPVDPEPTTGPKSITLTMSSPQLFVDINGHWAQQDIQRLQSLGVLAGIGNGQFAPSAPATRAQFVQMIGNLLKLQAGSSSTSYSDVSNDAWYLGAIQAASAAGIISGYGDNSFKPNRLVSREEMVQIIGNAIRYIDTNAPLLANANTQSLSTFRDASSVGNWARNNLSLAINAGLIQGKSSTTLSPKSSTTRAEAAAVLSRLIDRMNNYFNIN